MKAYFLFYGMSYAGMGVETNAPECHYYNTQEEAEKEVYELALQNANSWEGSHGIPSFTDDHELIESDPDEYAHYDEIDNYIEYYVEEATPEKVNYQSMNWDTNYEKQLKEEYERLMERSNKE